MGTGMGAGGAASEARDLWRRETTEECFDKKPGVCLVMMKAMRFCWFESGTTKDKRPSVVIQVDEDANERVSESVSGDEGTLRPYRSGVRGT